MGGRYSTHGEVRNTYKVLVRNPEGKRPLGRPRRRWEDNIRMELGEIRWEGVDWIHLALETDEWRALMNMEINLQVP
jgi:hypothetical protein